MKKSFKFATFIWNFQKAYKNNHISFITEDFVGLQKFLTDMYLKGFITGYKNLTKNKIKMLEVFLKSGPSNYVLSKIVSKPGRNIVINLNQLKSEFRNEPFSLGVIRTAKLGITTTNQAIQGKCGGIYLGKIK